MATKKEQPNYEEAMRRLESIVEKMESGQMDVDAMVTELKTAQSLIKLCRDKLTKTDEEIKKILDDDSDGRSDRYNKEH